MCGLQMRSTIDLSGQSSSVYTDAKIFYAVRGSDHDGVVTSLTELESRLQKPGAVSKQFDSIENALVWVRESKSWFAIKLDNGFGIAMSADKTAGIMKSQTVLDMQGPNYEFTSRNQAKGYVFYFIFIQYLNYMLGSVFYVVVYYNSTILIHP